MKLIREKAASLLVESAALDPTISWLSNYESRGLTNLWLKFGRGLNGGDWVGGVAKLYQDRLCFTANSFNDEILKDAPGAALQLSEITYVRRDGGLISGIIAMGQSARTVKIRCFGADEFAKIIESTRRASERLPGHPL
jgi:hypothetical protein